VQNKNYQFIKYLVEHHSKNSVSFNLENRPEKQIQPFGYTGYQMEAAGGLYFAQARRYDAGVGRFVSEDKIPGFTSVPDTLNRYNYCWNQPMEHVDMNVVGINFDEYEEEMTGGKRVALVVNPYMEIRLLTIQLQQIF